LDVARIQLQVSKEYSGALDCLAKLYKNEGLAKGPYAGLSAGILRQVTYGAPRMAIFPFLLSRYRTEYCPNGEKVPFISNLALAGLSGAVASSIGCPGEVVLVRMTSDSTRAAEHRRNYKNAGEALLRIARDDGVAALWSGVLPTVGRGMLINMGQLGFYAEVKGQLMTRFDMAPDSLVLMFAGSLVASFMANALAMPADVVKSRLQSGPPMGVMSCIKSTAQAEGIGAFWSGFGPAFSKVAPHTVISFVMLENLSRIVTGKTAL